MAGVNKKTLAAQSAVARETGGRVMGSQIIRDTQGEQQRTALQSGLGSQAQLSGSLSGAKGRDLSQYSQGLTVSSRTGDSKTTLGAMSKARAGTDLAEGKYFDAKGKLVDIGDKAGAKKGFRQATLADLAASGNNKATDEIRQNELFGSITQINGLQQQAYDAAKSGDYEAADQLRKQADDLIKSGNFNENFDQSGMKNLGLQFATGEKFDPLADTQGAANEALGSASGMLVGGVVNQARQMMDPASAESMRFKDSLTSGAIAAVDNSRDKAVRALGSEERGAARSMRDASMQWGGASQTVKMAAVAARSGERFAGVRADIEGDVAAQKAQIYGDAAKMYESFRMDLATNAASLASAWVNDQSGVRDNFRSIHNNLVSNYSNNLFGFAGTSQNNATQLKLANDANGGEGGLGGALSGAAAGAAAGGVTGNPWGALAGGVIGGVLGALK